MLDHIKDHDFHVYLFNLPHNKTMYGLVKDVSMLTSEAIR